MSDESRSITMEPGELCWALLGPDDGVPPGLRRGDVINAGAEALELAFAQWSPAPSDGLHIICVALADGLAVGVGVPRERIESLRAEGALDVRPSSWPLCIDAGHVAGLALPNVLIRDLAPMAVLVARGRRRRWIAVLTTVAVALVAVGLQRRVTAAHQIENRWAAASAAAAAVVTPGDGSLAQKEMTIRAELARLQRTHAVPVRDGHGRADTALEALLRAWPHDKEAPRAVVEALSVESRSIALTVLAQTPADAERLLSALRQVPAWTLHDPQISAVKPSPGDRERSTGDPQRLVLRLEPTPAQTNATAPTPEREVAP